MKPILAVIILFGLASLGVGVYFLNQAQVTQSQIQAQSDIVALREIVSNCDFWYLPDCTKYADPNEELIVIPREVDRLLRSKAAPSIQMYSEPVSDELYASLGKMPLLPVQKFYTPGEIISRVAIASRLNHRLLLAVFALQGKSAWDGDSLVSNPLRRKELSFAAQFAAVAKDLKDTFAAETITPTSAITMGTTTYHLDPIYVNAHSRALYLYLARTSTPEEFASYINPDIAKPETFAHIWESLR